MSSYLSLNIKLNSISFLSSFLNPIANIILLFIFFMQHRDEGYLPTISETGTELPNNIFMFIIFSTVSISFFFNNLVIILNLKSVCDVTNNLLKVCHVLNFSYLFFYMSISTCSLNEIPSLHHFSTLVSFYSIVILNFITTILTFKKSSNWEKIIRLFALISENLALIIVALSEYIFSWRYEGTIATLGEYYVIFANTIFSCSYYSNFKRMETYIDMDSK